MRSAHRKRLLVRLFVAVIFAIASQGSVFAQQRRDGLPHSMKGYELYSWRAGGRWNFSLVVGTNRQKTFGEIASSRSRIEGISALKRKLDMLPKGEDLFWSTRRMPKTSLPPKTIIDEIIAYARARQLNLRVS